MPGRTPCVCAAAAAVRRCCSAVPRAPGGGTSSAPRAPAVAVHAADSLLLGTTGGDGRRGARGRAASEPQPVSGRPLRRPRRRRAGAHTALRHPRQNRRAQRTGQGKRDCTRGRGPLFVAERGGALLSCLGPGPLPLGGGCDRRRRRRRVPGRGCAPAGRRDAGGGRGRHYWCGGRRRW